MAKDQDQTQQTEEDQQAEESVETKEEDTSTAKAVETSKKFDEKLDDEGVEETPPDDKEEKSDKEESEDKSEAEEKDAGKEKDEDSEKAETETTSKVSKELAKKASDYGLLDEEIATFENDEELQKVIDVLESVMAEDDEDQAAGAQPPTKKEDETDTGIKFKNEDEIDPEILTALRSLEQSNKELREQLKSVTGNMQQQQQQQFLTRFDAMISGLGKDFADVFGIGPTMELGKRSKAYRNRDAVRSRMYAFSKGLVDSGQQLPDEQQLFDLALNSLHKEKVDKVKGLRTKEKTDTHSKRARVQRAATKKTGPLTG